MPSEMNFGLRVYVARLEGENAMIVGGLDERTWEILPAEDTDAFKRSLLQKWLGPDWQAYDVREAVLYVPHSKLDALFAPPIEVEMVEEAAQG